MTDERLLIERLAIEDVFARYAHTGDGYDADCWKWYSRITEQNYDSTQNEGGYCLRPMSIGKTKSISETKHCLV